MEWSGKENFGEAKEVPFVVDGKEAGSLKSYGQLSFLKVGFSYINKQFFFVSADCLIVKTKGLMV